MTRTSAPRVLHVDTGREMRGGQWQALFLLEHQARHSAVLLARENSPLARMARGQGLEVRPLAALRLATFAWDCDLVHAHDARAHSLAAAFTWKPVIVARRVAFPVREGFLSRWKYRRAAHFIAVSEFVRTTLLAAGIPECRVSVVYDGVPVPVEESSRKPGRFVALASKDPGKCADLVAEAARRAGVEVEFSFDLSHDLHSAAALVYLSRSEGLGSAALLAQAAGVPVIASRVGGLPEIVRDGDTGLLVENDAGAVASALRRLHEDPALGAEMGRRGRAMVCERFSMAAMASATAAVYERILG